MEEQIRQMKSCGIQPPDLVVRHQREPRERMPVRIHRGLERPFDAIPGQPAQMNRFDFFAMIRSSESMMYAVVRIAADTLHHSLHHGRQYVNASSATAIAVPCLLCYHVGGNARLAARTEKEINLVAEEIVYNGGTGCRQDHQYRLDGGSGGEGIRRKE
ncbi:MAG: hypothetical protein NTU88_09080 [Armatimonadetes bacterium]|nr:hypothetical protein [Armatimonadota bacterium]